MYDDTFDGHKPGVDVKKAKPDEQGQDNFYIHSFTVAMCCLNGLMCAMETFQGYSMTSFPLNSEWEPYSMNEPQSTG